MVHASLENKMSQGKNIFKDQSFKDKVLQEKNEALTKKIEALAKMNEAIKRVNEMSRKVNEAY